MEATKKQLSYEKLLAILNQLPEEDGKYVLSFILHYEKQVTARIKELDTTIQKYETLIIRNRDRQHKLEVANKKKQDNIRQNMEEENRSREAKNINREERLKHLITHRQGIAESAKQLQGLLNALQDKPSGLKDEARWEYVKKLGQKIGQWLDGYHTTEKELAENKT